MYLQRGFSYQMFSAHALSLHSDLLQDRQQDDESNALPFIMRLESHRNILSDYHISDFTWISILLSGIPISIDTLLKDNVEPGFHSWIHAKNSVVHYVLGLQGEVAS